MAFELNWTSWKLAFTTGHGQQPRQRTIRASDLAALEQSRFQERFSSWRGEVGGSGRRVWNNGSITSGSSHRLRPRQRSSVNPASRMMPR